MSEVKFLSLQSVVKRTEQSSVAKLLPNGVTTADDCLTDGIVLEWSSDVLSLFYATVLLDIY